MARRSSPPVEPARQTVQYYADSPSLFESVGRFLGDGLRNGQPAIVIATRAHRSGILDRLGRRRIDCDRAEREGALVLLDARKTLAVFQKGRALDLKVFDGHIGGIIDATLRRHPAPIVRVYSEMVDVLWKKGQRDAATTLEGRWNALTLRYPFTVLCGYTMGSFYKEPAHAARGDVVASLEDILDSTRELRSEVRALLGADRVKPRQARSRRTGRTKTPT